MSGAKKNFSQNVSYKLYDASGNLTKKWFIYWYEGKKRIRKYGDINKFHTDKARRSEARRFINKLKGEHTRRISILEEKLWNYIDENETQWSFKTHQQYKGMTKIFMEFLGGREVNQQIINTFFNKLKLEQHASTYNRYLGYFKKVLGLCGYTHLFEGYKKLKSISSPDRYYQQHQKEQLIEYIRDLDEDLYLFIQFIYYCFIRPNELRHLRIQDIYFYEKQIRIPQVTNVLNEKIRVSKNRKTEFITIPQVFFPAIEHLKYYPAKQFVFPSKIDQSKPIGRSTMYRRHKAILDKLGFGEGYTLYSWKHTGAVAAAKAGISLKEIQMQLRHHSLDETDKYLRQMGVKDMAMLQSKFPEI